MIDVRGPWPILIEGLRAVTLEGKDRSVRQEDVIEWLDYEGDLTLDPNVIPFVSDEHLQSFFNTYDDLACYWMRKDREVAMQQTVAVCADQAAHCARLTYRFAREISKRFEAV
jgi:hypothetical protein